MGKQGAKDQGSKEEYSGGHTHPEYWCPPFSSLKVGRYICKQILSFSKNMDLTKISEYDPSIKLAIPPSLEHIDWNKAFLRAEEKARNIREQLPRGPNYLMRSEAKRLRSFLGLYQPLSSWSPKELASAGFFCTELESSVQCFCCGLVLCKTSLTYTPIERHRHFNPNCEFVIGADTGNIFKYEVHPKPVKSAQMDCKESMKDEQARLQSFSCWPPYALIEPSILAQAGFIFTGIRDMVQCFSCGGCLEIWEDDDEPWKEHAKWFPECTFVKSKISQEDIQQYIQNELRYNGMMVETFTDFLDHKTLSLPRTTHGQVLLFENVTMLKQQLIEKYTDATFHKVSPFGDSISIDLNVLFADISIVVKDTRNQPLRQLILPDILSELRDITMIEGEAGSGKTALLKKIAILWASRECPMLNRFSLVFYISLSSTQRQQSISDIICQQLIGSTEFLTEDIFGDIVKHFMEKVLFLLDDYGMMDSTPTALEDLMQKNPWNRVALTVTVNTSKSWKVRQYARTKMCIGNFSLYSTVYLVKNIFPHDIEYVKEFTMKLQVCENLITILQTPLMILTHCSSRHQNPTGSTFSDINLFKTSIKYSMLKFPSETEAVMSQMLSCGELALRGLFQSRFQFTDNDLRAAGVDSDRAIKYGLLGKFTAQRLKSIYRFFDSSFQEFLAGKRLSELLESETPEDLEKGLYYLHQVNTFLKLIGPYSYFMKYAGSISAVATVKMLSFLFSLYGNPESLDCHLENRDHLKQHPELEVEEEKFILSLRQQIEVSVSSVCMDRLMTFAVEAASACQGLPVCAPVIIQFLAGKTATFSIRSVFNPSRSILTFIEKFPESISVLKSFDFIMYNLGEQFRQLDVSEFKGFAAYGAPTVESDYSSTYLCFHERKSQIDRKMGVLNQFFSLYPQRIEINDAIIRPFLVLGGQKVPTFRLIANDINSDNFSSDEFQKLFVLFSMSNHIELILKNCGDFVKHIGPAIEQLLRSIKVLSFNNTYLTAEEQDLVLEMSSLKSLEIGNSLSSFYPVLLLQSFENLEYLDIGLKNVNCSDLMNSLMTCKKLKELNLHRSTLQESDITFLATAIKNFTLLKCLNLHSLKVTEKDTAETLAVALGSLTQLEKLWIPAGQGIAHAAKLIIEQFQKLPNLQFLSMLEVLDDESIALLGEETRNGCLEKIQHLQLQCNGNITESGWTKFFETAGRMPELSHLNIGRMYNQQIKSHATTVTSFVRFFSRLPRLLTIQMYGWLLDKDDLNMFEAMKENHPQAKSLYLAWQWVLPFSPIIEN
ncbi:PREDICTED: baculoviral IAP repeat-containing protein 1-like [Nanorana parkeri]|uniref:baculoviral IAP repeat-containing protein 1-like n=1 Tax=Nanorana parkeri TaxID=125878 RepID=UPI0008549368|nr:PREDICTED: baculoviral IAP repeat-containing protein 1-like [Nanorana parkeri]